MHKELSFIFGLKITIKAVEGRMMWLFMPDLEESYEHLFHA